ncbi:hypothetical protein FRC03_011667 [Tulasnella sp. 419]|nr:hypothetical protein FRC03_011667 [Tulasnella sp. 419]
MVVCTPATVPNAMEYASLGGVHEDFAQYAGDMVSALATWIIGVSITIFAQGVIFMQAVEYFRLCRYDGRSTRILVALITIATFIKCGFNFRNLWYLTVTTYGDFATGALLTWASSTNLLNGHMITFICQMFYLKRAWRITQSKILSGIIAFFCAASLTLTAVLTVPMIIVTLEYNGDFTRADSQLLDLIQPLYISGTALLVVADFMITGTMLWFLLSPRVERVEMSDESHSLLRRLIRVTLESATPPLITAIINLINYVSLPKSSVAIAFGLIMPSLYTICLMHTINHRCRTRIIQNRGRALSGDFSATKNVTCHCQSKYTSVPPIFANTTRGQLETIASVPTTRQTRDKSRQDAETSSTVYTIPAPIEEDRTSFDVASTPFAIRSGHSSDEEAQAYSIALKPIYQPSSDPSYSSAKNDSVWTLGIDDDLNSPDGGTRGRSGDRRSISPKRGVLSPLTSSSEIVFQPVDDEKRGEPYV